MGLLNGNSKDYTQMNSQQILVDAMSDLDEIKRYTANTYAKTDTEVQEIITIVRRIEQKLLETDRQVDRIEQYEKQLTQMMSSIKAIERKVATLK